MSDTIGKIEQLTTDDTWSESNKLALKLAKTDWYKECKALRQRIKELEEALNMISGGKVEIGGHQLMENELTGWLREIAREALNED